MFCKQLLVLIATLGISSTTLAKVIFPGHAPGEAKSSDMKKEGRFILKNDLLSAAFQINSKGHLEFCGLNSLKNKIAAPSENLFILQLADGQKISSSSLKAGNLKITDIKGKPKAFNLAERSDGKIISCQFKALNGELIIDWRAILRNDSHYLRQELAIRSTKPLAMDNITAMNYLFYTGKNGEPKVIGNTRGSVIANKIAFAGLETPMGLNTIANQALTDWSANSWVKDSWMPAQDIPQNLSSSYGDQLMIAQGPVNIEETGNCQVSFQYQGGDGGHNKLNIVGVQLLDNKGKVISEDFHAGSTGDNNKDNSYTVKVPKKGNYTLRYWVETKTEPVASKGAITFSIPVKTSDKIVKEGNKEELIQGTWSRKTTLKPGETWKVSSVLGLFAPGQERRSFLAYIERERAMPYRPFIHYNSWYELNINRNNDANPEKRMTEQQCLDVVKDWNDELFKKRDTKIDAFVWDDGWDEFNSLWDFHKMFPQGFKNIDSLARKQGAGTGAWLGPVGGYGSSKAQRLNNWNQKHPDNQIGNFQLSNKEYFDAFVGRCSQMIDDYDMRYFKFDGISTHFHAKGPANEEDAEGILKVVDRLRDKRGDLFINCTVGTWASPFWFKFADSVWRQENDWGAIGEGDKRDQWITYRDRLVHEVFTEGSPLMPINSLMTHGLMVTKFGEPNCMSKDPENVKKELRCAFACGTSLQELYVDRDLMNAENGKLWDELAQGIKWIERNKDVLDDIHWVGGNPWNKETKEGSVYGWAAWNKDKATLALRNSSAQEKSLNSTLREILDIPAQIKGSITFKDSYKDQRALEGFSGKSVDIDKPITFTLKPFEVFVYEGGTVK